MVEIVIQDCGCVAIPEDVAGKLGMMPGARLGLVVDEVARSITLTAMAGGVVGVKGLAACAVMTRTPS